MSSRGNYGSKNKERNNKSGFGVMGYTDAEKGMEYFQTQALAHGKTVSLPGWLICVSHISRSL